MARRIEVVRTPYSVVAPVNEITAPEWTNMTSFRSGFRHINLRTMGLSLDGTTDETAAFQGVIDGASDGDVIVLDERANLRIAGQVNANGKRLQIVGHGEATITSTQKLAVPLISIANSPGMVISGVRIAGPEIAFDGVLDTQAYGIYLQDCPDAVVRDVAIEGLSRGVMLHDCDRAQVDGLAFAGTENQHTTNINFMAGLTVRSSDDVAISRVRAESCGSAVLVGWDSVRGSIVQASGYNTFDNGIYISSGHGWEIHAPQFRADPAYTGTIGTGVKMRGNDNVLMGGYFDHMGIGAVITGTGIDNGDGFDGRGSRIIGARAIRPHTNGFSIEASGALPCRDAEIAGCYVQDSGWNGTVNSAAIRVLTGRGHKITNNTSVFHRTGTYAIGGTGTGESVLRNITYAGNKVRTPDSYAYQFGYNDRSRVLDNEMENVLNVAYGLRLVSTSNTEVRGTFPVGTVGTSAHIRIHDAASTNNRVWNNPQCTVSDAGTGTIASGNAS